MDRAWLVRILSDAGYCVATAKTGAEALIMIEAETYHAMLLDMILPDMIGWDVLHTIRRTGRNQSVPVIVISVINEREVAKGFPVQDYLAKPVSAEKLIQSLHRAEVRPNGTVKKILIIDDDPKILEIGSAALHSAGYEVVCYISAAQGLVAASEAEFDAVVLDLLMPGIDGFEFLERFREINGCRNTPVIVWTNKDITAEDRDRLKNSAQLITSEASVGIDAVLRELQLSVGATKL
jgi:CheY-like chemotaxis protein